MNKGFRKDKNSQEQGNLRTYVEEIFEFYKSLGFLEQVAHTKIDSMIDEMVTRSRKEFGVSLEKIYSKPKLRMFIDFLVLSCDNARVLFKYTKIKLNHQGKIYTDTIEQLKHISRGRFNPDSVVEVTDEPTGKIYLDYVESGAGCNIEFMNLPGVIDVGTLISKVNLMLDKKDCLFYIIEIRDFAIVMMLNENEKRSLEDRKKLRFVKENELENFPPAKLALQLKKFKSIFRPWRIFEVGIFILAVIDVIYLTFRNLLKLSNLVVGKMAGAGYGLVASRHYWIIVSGITAVIVGGWLARFLIKRILGERFQGYNVYLEMFCGEGRYVRILWKMVSAFAVCMTGLLIFSGLKWYTVFGEKITVKPLWQPEQTYDYKNISSITLTSQPKVKGKKTSAQNYLEIKFDGGFVWRSNDEGRKPSLDFDLELAKYISKMSGKAVERAD